MKERILKYGLRTLVTILVLAAVVAFLNYFVVVDIRPDTVKEGITQEMETKGRLLLDKMAKAHGNETWETSDTWSVNYRAVWKLPVAWMANHWPQNDQRVRFDAVVNSFDSRATILEGKHQNEEWGVQFWQAYKKLPNVKLSFKKDKNLAFGNPTVHYFVELPFRASNAPIVAYAGSITKDGKYYELVFISWKNPEPNKHSDQYVLYINKDTYRLDFAEYTVREQFNFLNSTVTYEGYRDIDGILFPSRFYNRVPYMSFLTFHDGSFTNWKLNDVASNELRPNQKLKIFNDEKP